MLSAGKALDNPNTDNVGTYTDSVRDLLKDWQDKKDPQSDVSLRVDGYDIDFEGANTVSIARTVLSQVRSKLGAWITTPPFYVSITPDTTYNLDGDYTVAQSFDYINMQNYDGGTGTTPDVYLYSIYNLKPSQLL